MYRHLGKTLALSTLILSNVTIGDPYMGSRATEAARHAGHTIRTLHYNPMDRWRRLEFQRAMQTLNLELSELAAEFHRLGTPRPEVARVQREITHVFEANAGKQSREVIREAMASSGLHDDAGDDERDDSPRRGLREETRLERESRSERTYSVWVVPAEKAKLTVAKVEAAPVRKPTTSTPGRIPTASGRGATAANILGFPQPEVAATAFRQMEEIVTAPKEVGAVVVPAGPKVARRPRVIALDGGAMEDGSLTERSVVASVEGPEGEDLLGPGDENDFVDAGLPEDGEVLEGALPQSREEEGFVYRVASFLPQVRAFGRAGLQGRSLSKEDFEELIYARGRFALMVLIVLGSFGLLALYLGMAMRARRATFARTDGLNVSR